MDQQPNEVIPKEDKEMHESDQNRSGNSVLSFFFDIFEMFAVAMFVVFTLFTFVGRVCQVDGQSMERTLFDKQVLLITHLNYTPEQGDIIVFHATNYNNKTLVKRIIGKGGQTVHIDFQTKEITVDGIPYEDSNAVFQYYGDDSYHLFADHYDRGTMTYTVNVPEGYLFCMGDNRNNSLDSRSDRIGFIDERTVLGKVVLRIKPFTVFN